MAGQVNQGMVSISHWGLFVSPYWWDYEGTPVFYVLPEQERRLTFVGDFA